MHLRRPTYLLLAAVMGMITGCCNRPTEHHYPINPVVMDMIPYNQLSVIEMRHSGGAHMRLSSIRENQSDFARKGCPTCCTEEFTQSYFNVFDSDSAAAPSFRISLWQTGEEGVADPTRMELDFGGAKYFAQFSDSTCDSQESMECVDSIMVAGQLYQDVFLFHNQSTSGGTTYGDLYYDKHWGIIRVEMTDPTIAWELIR